MKKCSKEQSKSKHSGYKYQKNAKVDFDSSNIDVKIIFKRNPDPFDLCTF